MGTKTLRHEGTKRIASVPPCLLPACLALLLLLGGRARGLAGSGGGGCGLGTGGAGTGGRSLAAGGRRGSGAGGGSCAGRSGGALGGRLFLHRLRQRHLAMRHL